VSITWASNHGITDQAALSNHFAAVSWSYTLDPNANPTVFVLNEFLAKNSGGLRDEDGDNSDWIEIFNPGQIAGNIGGWYLTDDPLNLTKWQFPYYVMDPGTFLLVFASGKDRTNLMAGTIFTNLHANFQIGASGGFLALVDPTGTNVVSAFNPYPAQSQNISYGRDRLDPTLVGFFSTPTPRAPNSTEGAGIAPEVLFSRDSGTFLTNSPWNLSLTTISSNAVIFYAVGTNLPGSNTVAYTNGTPIPVSNTIAIRARAFEAGKLPGPVTTKFYIGLATQTNVVNFSSGLPIMILHNYGQGVVPATKQDQYVFVEVFDNDAGYASLTNVPTLTARGDFHVRGSSTAVASTSKSSFFLEIRDEFDDGRNVPLLGMPSESDWVLYAPNNFEPALFHNPLAHALYRDTGHYGSRTRFFELFLKDDSIVGPITSAGFTSATAGEYQGIYVLEEKIKRDDHRVNVAKLDVEDSSYPAVTGGYVMAIDRANAGEGTVPVNFGTPAPIVYVSPNGFAMTNAARGPQTNYIKNYLNQFNADLLGPNWTNTATTNFYGNYIDVDEWVNFHIHEVIMFNVDGFRLSGYFYKDRLGPLVYGPTWDYDRTQGSTDGRDINPRVWRAATGDLGTDFFNFTPWWNRLLSAPDFWQKWIDRYQELRQPDGALSTNNVFAHIQDFYNTLAPEQPREQARWGIIPRQTNAAANGTYFTEVGWEGHWYGARLNFADTNFLAPPSLSLSPGGYTNTLTITVTPADGLGDKPANTQLIMTLDGTDPRLPGGAILTGPNVLSNIGPITVTVTNAARIFARSRNPVHSNLIGANNPPITSPWSGPAVGTYYLSNAIPPLRITEIMYHPPKPPSPDTRDADLFEYLEFKNISATPLNVNRFRLRGGVDFDFPNIILAAGQRCLLVADIAAFSSRYNTNGLIIAGIYGTNATDNRLGNGGDHLQLEGAAHEPILDFDYSDNWYPTTDGQGFSLQIVDENLPTSAWGLKSSWRPSGQLNGTPGTADPGPIVVSPIYVNEILTHTDPPQYDAIELYNPNGASVNVGGWFLTDNFSSPKKYRIPNGTSIAANGYLVFSANTSFGTAFDLSSKGEEVYLFSGDANTNLTGYVHGFDFGPQANGVTFGRYVTSTGDEQFPAQVTPSLGAANLGPKVGPIVISRINQHPPDILTVEGTMNNLRDEYIELANITGVPQPLYDPNFPTNTWKLRDAVDFLFPTNVVIPAGGRLIVVGFDPANSFAAASFRFANNIPGSTPLYGPFDGNLDNAGDNVELARPDVPQPFNAPDAGAVYYILTDKVNYSDQAPWPIPGASGFATAMQRAVLSGYGNDPINWNVPLAISSQPQSQNVRIPDGGTTGPTVVFTVAASGSIPISYQWRFNGVDIPGATTPVLTLNNVTFSSIGDYSAVASNPLNSATSHVARLEVFSDYGWRFASITGNYGNISNSLATNVLIFMTAAGEAYVDDISLVPLSGPYAGINLITNGDFESPLSGPWTVPAAMSSSVITNTYAHSGNSSLHVVSSAAGSIANAIKQVLPAMTTNIFCTMSYWYHTLPTGGTLNVRTFPGSGLQLGTNILSSDQAPGIALQPQDLTLVGGALASFAVSAWGSDPLGYQWFRNTVPLNDGGKISGANTPTLIINGARGTDSGNYSVKVSNLFGFTNSASAALNILGDPPLITTAPQSQHAPCFGSVTFTVAADGTAPLSYQWRAGLTTIQDATNTSLTLSNLVLANTGTYTVIVSNAFGTNSVDAMLVVDDSPSLSSQINGTNLVIMWLRSCSTFQLEHTSTLPSSSWLSVGTPVQENGNQRSVTIPLAPGNQFYRLRK
jgi:hypothetical protein